MWAETATNLDVIQVGDHYEMVTGSLVEPYDPVDWTLGLQWWQASVPSGDGADWSEPVFLLRTRDGPWWMQKRLLSPAIQYENGRLDVFFRRKTISPIRTRARISATSLAGWTSSVRSLMSTKQNTT